MKEVVNWAEFRQVHEVREVQGAGGHEDPSVVVDRGEETAEGGDGEDVEERERDDESAGEERDKEAETLTIGLIGTSCHHTHTHETWKDIRGGFIC